MASLDNQKHDSASGAKQPEVLIISFGYKKDDPPSANVVFDVRFLQNPYWVEELKHLTGKEKPVQDYVLDQPLAQEFLDSLLGMLHKILPCMLGPKHDRYTIALGCTGGQHRSASLVEALGPKLTELFPHYKVTIYHRELDEMQKHHQHSVHAAAAAANKAALLKGANE